MRFLQLFRLFIVGFLRKRLFTANLTGLWSAAIVEDNLEAHRL